MFSNLVSGVTRGWSRNKGSPERYLNLTRTAEQPLQKFGMFLRANAAAVKRWDHPIGYGLTMLQRRAGHVPS